MNCADLCPCFHRSHTISFRSRAGLRPNFGRSRSKLCPIVCRLRTKLCPYFGRSRARLCPISCAPCPFPNLAETLYYPAMWHHKIRNTAQRSRTFSFSQQNVSFTFLRYRFSRVTITTMLRCRVATCGIFWEIVFFACLISPTPPPPPSEYAHVCILLYSPSGLTTNQNAMSGWS